MKKNPIRIFNYCEIRNLLNTMEAKHPYISCITGCCLLLILAISIAGCTSPDTGIPVPTAPPAPVVTAAITTSFPLPSPTSDMTAPATSTQTTGQATQSDDPVSLTINSATKQTKLYTSTPRTGRIFLVLNITIRNNDLERGYDLTDTSISLSYAKAGISPVSSITSQVRGGLENPIIMPTKIERNDQRTGQVVFGVVDSSGRFTINLIGSDGAVVSSATVAVP
jgi:hypothetical protein